MTIESSVQQIQQRLTCPVCLEPFKQPKLLPCQHTFCLTPCLTNLADRSTRRVKCPECRSIHNLPLQGVEALPNNITIQRFLDLDLQNISSNGGDTIRSVRAYSENCAQCAQKHGNYFKCSDCDRFFCSNCKTSHINQLMNECKQESMNLRRILPKLSEKVGGFEQRKVAITHNFEIVKRDVTSVIEKLIDDLRSREKCLHAEADVYMQSQIRTISLEKENAEIELATVSSFCDSVESSLKYKLRF
jgi:tripartite motif-containing protein 71